MRNTRAAVLGGATFASLASITWACGGNVADGTAPDPDAGTADAAQLADAAPLVDAAAKDGGPVCDGAPCVTSVGSGGSHSCAVVSDGTIRCWGSNFHGELGSGVAVDAGGTAFTFAPPFAATPVVVAGEEDVVKTVAGGRLVEAFGAADDAGFTCALHADGTVDCWGRGGVVLGVGDATGNDTVEPKHTSITNAVDLSAGEVAACAVLADGTVACWGSNSQGQVHPPASADSSQFPYPSPTSLAVPGAKLVKVAVGAESVCAVAVDGHLWCWGNPSGGQTGHADDGSTATSPSAVPAQVTGIDGVANVAASDGSTCALKTDGSVWCFGSSALGMLGRELGADGGPPFDPTPQPVSVPAGTVLTEIAAHRYGFCALDTNADVWCWGYDAYGQTGGGSVDPDAGTVTPESVSVPTKVAGLADVEHLAGGALARFQCAVIRGGAVKCWGDDAYASIGIAPSDGGATYSIAPVTIAF